MKERYPFFREETERSLAVIGESAIEPDLNGQFEKSYAVLTSKQLYCKNERGNFIVENAQLLKAGISQGTFSFAVLLWTAFGVSVFDLLRSIFSIWSVIRRIEVEFAEDSKDIISQLLKPHMRYWAITFICLVMFFVLWKKRPKIAPIILCFYPVYRLLQVIMSSGTGNANMLFLLLKVVPIVLVVIYYLEVKTKVNNFAILYTGGSFTFAVKDYPQEELAAFSQAVSDLKSTSV